MDKNDVLEKLAELGFDLEEVTGTGYLFRFEELTFLYLPDEDDNTLRFAVPNIYDVTEENRIYVLEVMNATNLMIKYSKACIYDDNVWVFYEIRLFGDGDLEEMIEHSLLLLQATVGLFHRKVEGEDIECIDDEDDENNEDEE